MFGLKADFITKTSAMSQTQIQARTLYLDLIERVLLGTIYRDAPNDHFSGGAYRDEIREEGKDWPSQAHSMIGGKRMHNLRTLCEDLLNRDIPGDFIETGVWRGGACIMMQAILRAYGVTGRRVFVCDSFEGLPSPNSAIYPADAGDTHSTIETLKISLEEVKENFERYGLRDGAVFVKGWFKDTLHKIPSSKFALIRLDGDMYESTIQGLDSLYARLEPGGYLIVDDYGAIPACKAAVDDFRRDRQIVDPMTKIDWTGVFWQKSK
jgi:hypothetical protein